MEGPSQSGPDNRIRDRVAQLRSEGRRRRLLVQLPPLVGGIVLAIAGGVLFVNQRKGESSWFTTAGLVGLHTGPWCTGLALRPHDRGEVRALCAFGAFLSISSLIASVPLLLGALERANEGMSFLLFSISFVPNCVGVSTSTFLFVRAIIADVWFGASSYQTTTRAWHGTGVLDLWCSLGYAGFAFTALLFPNEDVYQRIEAAGLFPLCLLTVFLGCSSFWEPLRTRVQEKLASIGEGISAAAGIAELIGGVPPDEVLARARQTFRALPVAALTLEHLIAPPKKARGRSHRASLLDRWTMDGTHRTSSQKGSVVVPEAAELQSAQHETSALERHGSALALPSSEELFAVSSHAQLGSVDIFISHRCATAAQQRLCLAAWHAPLDRRS
jgi:hypothetical protein